MGPGKKTREATHTQRIQIHTLANIAHWTLFQIATFFQFHLSTIYRILHEPATPRKRKLRGRKPILDGFAKRRLFQISTQNSTNRRKTWPEIARIAGIKVCDKTLRKAFRSQGLNRRVARRKPFLTAAAKALRFVYALEHQDWTVEDWARVIWTDESYIRLNGRGGRVYVTRLSTEEYHEDCLVPKFQNKSSVMIWGAISGVVGGVKSEVLMWKKADWGNINALTYCTHVITPILFPFWRALCDVTGFNMLVMEDGAPAHRARSTEAVREQFGMKRHKWVASSPDLNPIEDIWRIIKGRLNARSDRATDLEGAVLQIKEEWAAITPDEIFSLVQTMPARISAVIAAQGGHTKY